MSTMRFTSLLTLCALLTACSDSPTSRSIAPPDAPSFDVLTDADPSALRAVDLSALGEVGSLQAATGGRASGHADALTFGVAFTDTYSFIALSTAPSPTTPFAAKGEFEGGYVNAAGTLTVEIHGDVDCLAIVSNEAWVSGPIEEYIVNGVSLPTTNRQFLIRVRDNGEGGTVSPDQVSFISEPFAPQTCRLRPPLVLSQNRAGNIQVRQR